MTVTLPDSLRDWIETQASLSGYANADDFVANLLRAEQARTQTTIDNLLLEGLASGDPIEVNAAFWAERRQVLNARLARHAKDGE